MTTDSDQQTTTTARVDLPDTVTGWLTAYREARDQADHWTEIADRARERIQDALGEAEEGYVDGRPAVRWTYVHSSRVDVKKLTEQLPDVAEQFRTPTVTRRFTLAKP